MKETKFLRDQVQNHKGPFEWCIKGFSPRRITKRDALMHVKMHPTADITTRVIRRNNALVLTLAV